MENNRNMKKQLILNYPNLILAIINLIAIFFGIFYIRNGFFDYDFFTIIIFVGMAWLAPVADKLLRLKFSALILCFYYIFLILALFFGRILSFYYYFSWYRSFIHFLGGVFSSLVGIYLIVRLDNIGFLKFSVVMSYALFFSGFTTSLWTIISGLISEFFGTPQLDLNRRIAMGLMGAIFSSILLILDYLIYHSKYLEKLLRKI